jgi:hypothetical protein
MLDCGMRRYFLLGGLSCGSVRLRYSLKVEGKIKGIRVTIYTSRDYKQGQLPKSVVDQPDERLAW